MNFDNSCIFHKHLRPTCDAEKKFVKKKISEANFSNLVSYLLYAYQKKSTEKLLAKSILWAKLDMRILQRLALKYIWKTASRVVIEVGNLGYLARDISPNGKRSLLVLIYSKLHALEIM